MKTIIKCRRVKPLEFGARLCLQVISINGTKLEPFKYKIYIDETTKILYYKYNKDTQVQSYAFKGSYQQLTVEGITYKVWPADVEISPYTGETDEDDAVLKPTNVLEVGKIYELQNGSIMKIIAFEDDLNFVSEPTFVGVCSIHKNDYVIRYTQSGELCQALHDTFKIKSEYKENKIWIVINPIDRTCSVASFYIKKDAENYFEKFGGILKEIDLDEEMNYEKSKR
jgi:hypothetical protein